MSVLYILSREPSSDKMVKIDVCDNYIVELDELNKQLRNVGNTEDHFEAFATFSIKDGKLTRSRLENILKTILSKSLYAGCPATYYKLTPEDAYNVISALFDFAGISGNGRIIGSGEEADSSNNTIEEISTNDDYVVRTAPAYSKAFAKPFKSSNKSRDQRPLAIDYIRRHNTNLPAGNITYASNNSVVPYYWANPQVYCINKDWYLILDDMKRHIFYVFFVPEHTFTLDQFETRIKAGRNCLQLKISYNDNKFTDAGKGVEFASYKIAEISYEPTLYSNKDIIDPPDSITKSLPNLTDYYFTHPSSFTFRGVRYPAEWWKDIFDVVLAYVYDTQPDLLTKYADENWLTSELSKVPFMTRDVSLYTDEDFPHQIGHTGIFFKTNYSTENIINLYRLIFETFKIDEDQLIVTYHKTEGHKFAK